MKGSQFWELYNSYGQVYLKEEGEKWVQAAHIHKGSFTKKANAHNMSVQEFAREVIAHPDKYDTKTLRQANLAQTLTGMAHKKEVKESYDTYDIVLDYILDEGYCDNVEDAEVLMAHMSEEWIDSILEYFVDPESDETPSGQRPLDKVTNHPSRRVRRKAIRGFLKQMEKNYGGKWSAGSDDGR